MLQRTYLHFIEEEATNSQAGKGTDSTWGVVAGEAGWWVEIKKRAEGPHGLRAFLYQVTESSSGVTT